MASEQLGVLLDTSFFIRLLDRTSPLHASARVYFQYFLDKGHPLHLSTISVAEYCTRGTVTQLPMKNVRILPFNLDHGVTAGPLAKIVFDHKVTLPPSTERLLIPNDTKLMAQAHKEPQIGFYATSDTRSRGIYELLNAQTKMNFRFLDIAIPCAQAFSELDFGIGENL